MGTSTRWSATRRRCLVAIGQLDRVSGLGEESDLTADSCRREEASSSSLRFHAWRSGGCHLRSCFIRRITMRRMPSPDSHRAEVILSSRLAFLPWFGSRSPGSASAMARQPRSTGHQHGVSRYSLATQHAQGRTKLQATRSTAGRRHSSSPRRQAPSTQRLTVKQEELDAGIDVSANYMTQVDASNDVDGPLLCYKRKKPYPLLCHKHKKSLGYIHRPFTAGSAPKYKVKEIHLKEGQPIVRGSCC